MFYLMCACVRVRVRSCVRVCVCVRVSPQYHSISIAGICSMLIVLIDALRPSQQLWSCRDSAILWDLCPKFSLLCLVLVRAPLWPHVR